MKLLAALLLIVPPSFAKGSPVIELPGAGTWKGVQYCQKTTAPEVDRSMDEETTIRIQGTEILNTYADNDFMIKSNVMVVAPADSRPQLLADAEMIESFLDMKVLSAHGRAMFAKLVRYLKGANDGLEIFKFVPNERVISGSLACDMSDGWCHYEARKSILVKPEGMSDFLDIQVEGGDVQQVIGDKLYRVGYAFDDHIPNQRTIWVCEMVLDKVNSN